MVSGFLSRSLSVYQVLGGRCIGGNMLSKLAIQPFLWIEKQYHVCEPTRSTDTKDTMLELKEDSLSHTNSLEFYISNYRHWSTFKCPITVYYTLYLLPTLILIMVDSLVRSLLI